HLPVVLREPRAVARPDRAARGDVSAHLGRAATRHGLAQRCRRAQGTHRRWDAAAGRRDCRDRRRARVRGVVAGARRARRRHRARIPGAPRGHRRCGTPAGARDRARRLPLLARCRRDRRRAPCRCARRCVRVPDGDPHRGGADRRLRRAGGVDAARAIIHRSAWGGRLNVIAFVHEGLGNSSYLVDIGEGRALLVDPDRTLQRYLDAARARGWRIEAVLETHLHADFVSGAREAAAATGATLFLPRDARVRLPHEPVDGASRFALDGIAVEAVGSPGHTPEHLSYVLRAAASPPALFSGGSLIVGGAARTDLVSDEMTEALTHAQYRTLRDAFATLPDETALYPTHGAGSFCSAGTGGTRTSTLGAERATN